MSNIHPTMLAALRSFAPLANDSAQPTDIQRTWAQRNPFERASSDMVREVQKLARQPRQPQAEPAPL
jgi:hypothetical protein